MGTDKGLLSHPEGGNWLSHVLLCLGELGIPISVLSSHPAHLAQVRSMASQTSMELEAIEEPAPREGPLLALGRLMDLHGGERLLLCPVDMPWLKASTLRDLVMAAELAEGRIHIAHDGSRPQPLLGIYPADDLHRQSLSSFLAAGGRSLLRWLEEMGFDPVPLTASSLRNANHPADRDRLEQDYRQKLPQGRAGGWPARTRP